MRLLKKLMVATSLVLSSGLVHAGSYSDEMGKCFVGSVSEADKGMLVRWVFANLAVHPDLQAVAKVGDKQRAQSNKEFAKLFEHLLLDSCQAQTKQALQYEGEDSIGNAFKMLAEVSTRSLFNDPQINTNMAKFSEYIDHKKLETLRP